MITKEQLAARLNGREYREEMESDEEEEAKRAGLVVVFGASDDLIEFRGAINDEDSCYDGGTIYVTEDGPLEPHDDCECEYCGYKKMEQSAKKIEAIWDKNGYSWTYETEIPHATFDIVEGEEKYCRGIVFSVKDL